MTTYYKNIQDFLCNHEYITIKDAQTMGIGRHVLAMFVKQGKLKRIERGIYSNPNEWIDEFEIFQKKNERAIYSYGTALYFHELSDRTPNVVHISVPQGYNALHIKKEHMKVVVHYVKKDNHMIGIETVQSPQGGNIKVYDKERCICELIRDKKNIDMQVYQASIKRYFKFEDKDLRKLLKYSKEFNIEDKVRNYIEVLV